MWFRGTAREDDQQRQFERVALVAAIVPLTFAIFGAAVPAYGLRYNTLFGFLLFMAAGLALIARRRGPEWLHVLGGAGVLPGGVEEIERGPPIPAGDSRTGARQRVGGRHG